MFCGRGLVAGPGLSGAGALCRVVMDSQHTEQHCLKQHVSRSLHCQKNPMTPSNATQCDLNARRNTRQNQGGSVLRMLRAFLNGAGALKGTALTDDEGAQRMLLQQKVGSSEQACAFLFGVGLGWGWGWQRVCSTAEK